MNSQRLFPTDLPPTEWVDFDAMGFNVPVTGVVLEWGTATG